MSSLRETETLSSVNFILFTVQTGQTSGNRKPAGSGGGGGGGGSFINVHDFKTFTYLFAKAFLPTKTLIIFIVTKSTCRKSIRRYVETLTVTVTVTVIITIL